MKYLYIIIFFIFLSACREDGLNIAEDVSEEISTEDITSMKEHFSLALAKVLAYSKEARLLIKQEALKQFDYDYDVLYLSVKDLSVEQGETFEKLLLRFLDKQSLDYLLSAIPNLTIFVPSLPNESFSAESWDVSNEIPNVAYMNSLGKVCIVDSEGQIDIIPSDIIPLYPVVVVKSSERVVVSSTLTRNIDILGSYDGKYLYFGYSEYNNRTGGQPRITVEERKKREADSLYKQFKDIFEAKKYSDKNGIWQRDYIYYNISTMDGKGVLNKNISECLYAFELMGDKDNIYKLLSDQEDDPHYNLGASPIGTRENPNVSWIGGNFEFLIKVYVSNKELVSNEIVKALSISPSSLFSLELEDLGNRHSRIVGIREMRRYVLPNPLPLFDWNIDNYSTAIKISIEEVDDSGTEQNVIETTSSFASNFGFDVGLGEKVKLGAKWGASESTQYKVSTTIIRTLGSDQLGDVIVNFGDDIVTKTVLDSIPYNPSSTRILNSYYRVPLNPKYQSGYYKIEVAPLPMY